MCSTRSWYIRIPALVWPVALVITLAVNPAAQAGTTGGLETKLRLGGPVPVKGDEAAPAASSAIVQSSEAGPAAASRQASLPKGDQTRASQEAWVWQCEPTTSGAVQNPNAVCDNIVALR
jgi:hypothetical protein